MADNSATTQGSAQQPSDPKGKGKATEPESHDASMEEADDSSSEEEVDEVGRAMQNRVLRRRRRG
jgi:hypothetical protein